MKPAEVYGQRLAARLAERARLEKREARIAASRLAVAVLGAVMAWLAFGPDAISRWWLAAPLVGFAILVVVHDRTIRAKRLAARAAAFHEAGIARLESRWAGGGESGSRFLDPSHPYAADLDVFGHGSLFELLCTARTRMGESALAGWLAAPCPPRTVRERQEAVVELAPRIDLREDVAVIGDDVGARVRPDELAEWASAPASLRGVGWRYAAAACSSLSVASLVGWWLAGLSPLWFLAAVLAQGVFAAALRGRVREVVREVEHAGSDLDVLAPILARLERERFSSPWLAARRRELDTEGLPPSRRIAHLDRLVQLLQSRRNQLFAPFAALLLLGTQLAFAVEAWRERYGGAVRRWLDAVGELEALLALAGYRFEHPRDPFPEFEEEEGPTFAGEALGHPLLSGKECVVNDVSLGREPKLLVVSGSNMSGKSTLLRTVGVNAVLAAAGAPVRARRLRLSPLAVGAILRVQDSLQEGSSRFYNEITRMRRLVDMADSRPPLLFLLDEILHGTNSHDRLLGAEAVVKSLLRRGAIGLVTTHDLALARIADELGAAGANVHFEDRVEDGKILFDYRLRPGIVRRGNALDLMRGIGLEV